MCPKLLISILFTVEIVRYRLASQSLGAVMCLRSSVGFLVLATLTIAGCSSGPAKYSVSGLVTYKDTPLKKGKIAFYPETQQPGGTDVLDITDGKYQGQVTAGKKRVEIYAEIDTGKTQKDEDGKVFPVLASLPAKYNEKSKLTAEIKPEINTGVDFQLD